VCNVVQSEDKRMIDNFRGNYAFLSNFFHSTINFEGIRYPTLEHAYQAQKASTVDERIEISKLHAPGEAKMQGKILRPNLKDWELRKDSIMLTLLRIKFSHPRLAELLLETGDEELIEGNTWHDVYWGVCDGVGKNVLGKMLMQVREEIKAELKGGN
jgi:ribA/ribD-fused uncharacterized protein